MEIYLKKKKRKEELLMNLEKLKLENRINLLSERSPEESKAIIKKLQRKLRKLNEENSDN